MNTNKNLLLTLATGFIIINSSLSFAAEEINTKVFPNINEDKIIEIYKNQTSFNLDVNKAFRSPIVNNSMSLSKSNDDKLRVISWDIDNCENIEEIANVLARPDSYLQKEQGNKQFEKIHKEIELLKGADIILFNEMKITNNNNHVLKGIAKLLKLNYAFGLEFLDLEHKYYTIHPVEEDEILSEKTDQNQTNEVNETENTNDNQYIEPEVVNEYTFQGLQGNAILSKYPLQNVRIIRLPQAHLEEKTLDKFTTKNYLSESAAKKYKENKIITDIQLGSNIALIADIKLENYSYPITIVITQLEERAHPKFRHAQLKYLLEQIKTIDNPLILAGDFQTTNKNLATSTAKKVLKGTADASIAIGMSVAVPGAGATTLIPKLFQWRDPTSKISIPFVASNKERELFKTIDNTEFGDGEKFDLSGDKELSLNNKDEKYANSNHRGRKGFIPTQNGAKTDWFFVKPKNGTFFPSNGATLYNMNFKASEQLSDHAPICVDIDLSGNKISTEELTSE